jgi:hypothetical protein
MANELILSGEESINFMPTQPRTAADVGLNLLAEFIRKKKKGKDEQLSAEAFASALELKGSGAQDADIIKALGSGGKQAKMYAQALMGKEFGIGASESDNVQSVFTTPEGKLGYLTRSGKPVITDQSINKGLNINQQTGVGINPLTGQAFDLANQPLQTVGGGQPQSTQPQTDMTQGRQPTTLMGRQVEIEQAKIDREIDAEKKKQGIKLGQEAETLGKESAVKMEIWDSVSENISKSFAGATTNPLTGMLPALTESQQTAEASLTTAIPTLKEFFRKAGEGTFTEGDQKILVNMLPTRSDYPDVRDRKLKQIDTIIRLKLGQPVQGLTGEDAEAALWANDPKNFNSDAAKAIRQQLGL